MAIIPNNLTNLDFDQLKTSLRDYMKGQTTFKDFNFEGSTISELLNILTYNSLNQSFLLNSIGSEMFIDSAQRRDSVVSIAKQIGYTPQSRKSAFAQLYIKMTPEVGVTLITIPEGTRFSTSIDSITYYFQTLQDYTVEPDDNNDFVAIIEVVEGIRLTHKYTISTLADLDKIVIPNKGVDITKLKVEVKDSYLSSTATLYTFADDILIVDDESTVYFVDETFDGKNRIYFGDGVLGKSPIVGNQVVVTYLVSAGELPNGAALFNLESAIADADSVTDLVTNLAAVGGKEQESIESIRLNAPLFFETQNRAVTSYDYARIIKKNYGYVDSVSVWGGEDSDPPAYGFVFISIKPVDGFALSDIEKARIEEDLIKKYNVVSITPKVVDPDFLFVTPHITTYYDPTKTNDLATTLKQKIINAVFNYGQDTINKFDTSLKGSRFTTFIDALDNSFVNSDVWFDVTTQIDVINTQQFSYSGSFNNAIEPGTFKSALMTFSQTTNAFIEDDGAGNLRAVKVVNNSKSILASGIGTINYITGAFTTTNILINTGSSELPLKFSAQTTKYDIYPIRNQIIYINEEDIDVDVIDVNTIQTFSSRL